MTLLLYTRPDCAACARLKAHLDRLGIAYTMRDLDDPEWAAHVKAKGLKSAPALVHGRRRAYAGYSPEGLDAWLKEGGVK